MYIYIERERELPLSGFAYENKRKERRGRSRRGV